MLELGSPDEKWQGARAIEPVIGRGQAAVQQASYAGLGARAGAAAEAARVRCLSEGVDQRLRSSPLLAVRLMNRCSFMHLSRSIPLKLSTRVPDRLAPGASRPSERCQADSCR